MNSETTFAKINREAEASRTRYCADGNIWNTPDVWMECGGSNGLRPTEDMVCAKYRTWARVLYQKLLMETIREYRQVAQSANLPSPNHKKPLREVMYERGETLQWINLGRDALTGKKHTARVVVKISATK